MWTTEPAKGWLFAEKYMRWDDALFAGKHKRWSWVVVRKDVSQLSSLVTEFHEGQRMCRKTLKPSSLWQSGELLAPGWVSDGRTIVSPPLVKEIDVPLDECEWYIFPDVPPRIDITVGYRIYCGFNLADPHALADSQDPTWDRTNYDWLIPIQAQFWRNIERLNPSSYVSSGCHTNDNTIVVTGNADFARRVVELASGT